MKTATVFGGNGFIGHHIARELKRRGYWVRTVDINEYTFGDIDYTDDYVIGDLRDEGVVTQALLKKGNPIDELYVLASWMGGAGVIFSGEFDDEIMYNSLSIDLNSAKCATNIGVKKVFWSSSACCYNADLQLDPNNTGLKEYDAYPANPDSDYGFAKLTSERIYQAFHRNKGLDVKIARFHNIFGEEGSWNNNKEKFPAAICRKVAMANDGDEIEVWGDGLQTRTFLYVHTCVDGVMKLMSSNCVATPVNIGSSEIISINDLTKMVIGFSGKNLKIKNVESNALGVRGRSSNNDFVYEKIGWKPDSRLADGMLKLFNWVNQQVINNNLLKK